MAVFPKMAGRAGPLLRVVCEPKSQAYCSHSFSNIYFVREEKLVSKQKNPHLVEQDLGAAVYVRSSSHEALYKRKNKGDSEQHY